MSPMPWGIINKEDALASGSKWYFTNRPCRNGHVDRRYVNTGLCYGCKRQQMSRDWRAHKQRVTECNRRSDKKHKAARDATKRKWILDNIEKVREIKKRNKLKYKDKYLQAEKDRQKQRRKDDALWKLNKNMSKAVWKWLKQEKGFRHWETFVSFTVLQLKEHLENKFDQNMTWENYGSYWHVDHIKPVSKCSTFEEAWALTNLQPLEKIENLRKGNRI